MRILVVGAPHDRARLLAGLDGALLEVVGEFGSLGAAEESGIDAEAILLARPPRLTSEPLVEPLTPREVQVLELLAEGLPNKAIAARLGISDQTVKFHVASVAAKLGASNRTDIVRRAVRRGLITL